MAKARSAADLLERGVLAKKAKARYQELREWLKKKLGGPPCPRCGSTNIRKFPIGGSTFGDIHYTDHVPEKLAYRNVLSIFKVSSWRPSIIFPPIEEEPEWHCEDCGCNYGKIGG